MKLNGIAIALVAAVLFFSCATAGKNPQVDAAGSAEPVAAAADSGTQEPAESTEPVVGKEPSVETAPAETPKPVEPPPEEAAPPPEENPAAAVEAQEDDAIIVSEEVFAKTFSDIEALIAELSKIIRAENYDAWVKFLSRDYISMYSDSKMLDELSKQPLLQKYNIKLKNLKDYFTYVVVQSRSNASLADLVFLSENRVKAISVINGQRVILYILENSNGSWKIGTLQK